MRFCCCCCCSFVCFCVFVFVCLFVFKLLVLWHRSTDNGILWDPVISSTRHMHSQHRHCLKGERKRRLNLAWKRRKYALCSFYQCSHKTGTFSVASNLSSSGRCHAGSRWVELVGSWRFDTFATHSGLVHDVTDTDYWTQNGSNHSRVLPTFKYRLF